MYKDLIDWNELEYITYQLRVGKLNPRTVSQRIYRSLDVKTKLMYKFALAIYQTEKEKDED